MNINENYKICSKFTTNIKYLLREMDFNYTIFSCSTYILNGEKYIKLKQVIWTD